MDSLGSSDGGPVNDERPRRRISWRLALAVIGVLALTGCASSGRSVKAYCKTFYQQGSAIRAEYSQKQQDPLTSLASLVAAPQELSTFFARLDKVAPDDIEPDIAVLQRSFQQSSDGLGAAALSPLGGMVSGLVNGLSSSASYTRVDQWTSQNCGPPPS
jgi:hypothetical protein